MKTLVKLFIMLIVVLSALGLCKPAFAQDNKNLIYLPLITADYTPNPITMDGDGNFTYISGDLFIVGCFPYDPNQALTGVFPDGLQTSVCGVSFPGLIVFENGSGVFDITTDSGVVTIDGCFVPKWGC